MTRFRRPRFGVARPIETLTYLLFVLFALAAAYWVCYFSPVTYVRLINEDQWGEYATAVSFGLAGLMLFILAPKSHSRSGKILWALGGLCALIIAAEEISWGERIFRRLFGITLAPDGIVQINKQGELNFHNLGNVDFLNQGVLYRGVGPLILVWTILSLIVAWLRPSWSDRIEKSGLPLIRMHVSPFFLAVSYVFLQQPLPRSDELGELFLGIAVLSWATDLFIRYRVASVPRGAQAVSMMSGVYVLCAVLTTIFVWVVPGGLRYSLNSVARISYPHHGMYEQAEQLYAYIYANPQYLKPETRVNHGRMLLGLGQAEIGYKQLRTALSEMDQSPEAKQRTSNYLRRKGVIHSLMGDRDMAEKLFDAALTTDETQAELARNPEDKAKLLFSVAQTQEAMRDVGTALETARRARGLAESARLSAKLDRWIVTLSDQKVSEVTDED